MRLFSKTAFDNEKKLKNSDGELTVEEINKTISEMQYCKADSLSIMLDKYKTLCELKEKCADKRQQKKIYNAQWVFVNSIQSTSNKQELIELIVNVLPFAKSYSKGMDALKAVTSIGMKALKGVSVVGKVATLGMASKAMDSIEGVVQSALVSQDAELTMLWRNKLASIFEEAKALSGGWLSKDKEFASQLKELKRQFDIICSI